MTPLSPLDPLSDPRHQPEGHSPSQWGGGGAGTAGVGGEGGGVLCPKLFVPIAVYIRGL